MLITIAAVLLNGFVCVIAETNSKVILMHTPDGIKRANDLAGRKVWILIGDQDKRVNTDNAVQLAREISRESRENKLLSKVTLHVLPEPRGHMIPAGADRMAADWILQEINNL